MGKSTINGNVQVRKLLVYQRVNALLQIGELWYLRRMMVSEKDWWWEVLARYFHDRNWTAVGGNWMLTVYGASSNWGITRIGKIQEID